MVGLLKTYAGRTKSMKEFWGYMIQFTELGGMLYIMVALFLIGFSIKTIGNFYYDVLLEKLEKGTWSEYKWFAGLVAYEAEHGEESKERLQLEVKRALHNWRCFGVPVEQMQRLGDAIAGVILILGVYSHLAVSIVLGIALKIWDKILAVDYKHYVIRDELYACLLQKMEDRETIQEGVEENLNKNSDKELNEELHQELNENLNKDMKKELEKGYKKACNMKDIAGEKNVKQQETATEPITIVNVEIKKDIEDAKKELEDGQARKIRVVEPSEKKKRSFSKSKEAVFDEMINEFLS